MVVYMVRSENKPVTNQSVKVMFRAPHAEWVDVYCSSRISALCLRDMLRSKGMEAEVI